MSTEHQKYSTENQADAIHQYASQRGLTVVKTYADEGKSGLSLDGREALQQLINDVQSGRADFETILVYDVSRWGRFQDADESAYYEYICRRSGISVQYCAEQFENDGSPVSTIVKGVKRAMAGEYSRELSGKVFIGQCRLIELGFRQGGPAGYGLRRMLVDERGTQKGELGRGEHKSIQTDRIKLIPGPPTEVDTIRLIYETFVHEGKSEHDIAADLNSRGIMTDLNRPWTRATVHQVLINEKYIGNNVWNHSSFKLKRKRVRNAPDMWVRAERAFEPVVELTLFESAQTIIRERSARLSDEEMLQSLSRVFERHGYLSGLIIDEAEDVASSSVFRTRFGSLLRAYELVGFTPDRDYRYVEINRALRQLHPEIVSETANEIERVGGRVVSSPLTDLVTVNDEFTASIVIARCQETGAGSLRWHIRFDTRLRPDITIAVRMAYGNQQHLDYYLLPALAIASPKLRLSEENDFSLDSYRFDTLAPFVQMAERSKLSDVA